MLRTEAYFYDEHEARTFLQNAGTYIQDSTALHLPNAMKIPVSDNIGFTCCNTHPHETHNAITVMRVYG